MLQNARDYLATLIAGVPHPPRGSDKYLQTRIKTSLRRTSYLGSQHDANRRRSSGACGYRSIAGTRRRRPQLSIAITCPRSAANQPHAAAVVDWRDGQTDRRTLDRYIDPALHTMRAASTTASALQWLVQEAQLSQRSRTNVCMSVCWSEPCAVPKRMNRSTCGLGCGLGWSHRLRNDLYCVEWGVKLYSNQTKPNQTKEPYIR